MLDIIESKLHLTMKGLILLLKIKSAFPKGLISSLKIKFPSIKSITLPCYLPNLMNINYFWLAGFITPNPPIIRIQRNLFGF